MFLKLVLLSLLFSTAASQYLYAVDVSVPLGYSQIQCLQQAKYSNLLVRGFKPDGKTGLVDTDGISTYKLVQNNNMAIGVSIYMEPDAGAKNTGGQQFDMLYQGLTNAGIHVRQVFVQVTEGDQTWNYDHNANVDFLNSLFLRAQQLGILIGIYTGPADWQTITGNAVTMLPADAQLWYYNVYWDGVTGETVPSFDDFVAFGPFKRANVGVKQFATKEQVCGLTVNRDVYLKA